MKEILHQEAWKALTENNFALAATIWLDGFALPDHHKALKSTFQSIHERNETASDPNLYALIGVIALDHNEIFELNREKALETCLDWSIKGIEIDPQNYHCTRNAGSALYWLDDWKGALAYYKKSILLRPSPVLEIRIFNILNHNHSMPDFSDLTVSVETQSGMEAYNAGVEINKILEQHPEMPDAEKERLIQLKIELYRHSYHLYKRAIVTGGGSRLNNDPHTFAMCCNNLARELNLQEAYEEAAAIAAEGIEQSRFMYILQNRMSSYLHANMPEKAIQDGILLLEYHADEMDLAVLLDVIDGICTSYIQLKQYNEALEWADRGLEIYYQVDPVDPVLQDPEIIRCLTNFFINKSKATAALGLDADTGGDVGTTDAMLETMPDNPGLIISRADTFIGNGQFEKALQCYDQAIHFGLEKGYERSVQVALYNRGYILTAHFKDNAAGLESFEQSIHYGNTDFWCFYWAAHTAYHLREDEKTVHYGSEALSLLSKQEGVEDYIVAEIYEHIGASQIDLGNYMNAVENLEKSLELKHSPLAENNLKIAREHSGKSGGFFKKFFGN